MKGKLLIIGALAVTVGAVVVAATTTKRYLADEEKSKEIKEAGKKLFNDSKELGKGVKNMAKNVYAETKNKIKAASESNVENVDSAESEGEPMEGTYYDNCPSDDSVDVENYEHDYDPSEEADNNVAEFDDPDYKEEYNTDYENEDAIKDNEVLNEQSENTSSEE